jgi:predicted metal-dependent TIM-barrel fold hydrolase
MIPHNTEEYLEKTIEIGTWAGLAVYPHIELSSSCAINHKQISNRTCYDKQAS